MMSDWREDFHSRSPAAGRPCDVPMSPPPSEPAKLKSLEEQTASVIRMSALSAKIFTESRAKLRTASRQYLPPVKANVSVLKSELEGLRKLVAEAGGCLFLQVQDGIMAVLAEHQRYKGATQEAIQNVRVSHERCRSKQINASAGLRCEQQKANEGWQQDSARILGAITSFANAQEAIRLQRPATSDAGSQTVTDVTEAASQFPEDDDSEASQEDDTEDSQVEQEAKVAENHYLLDEYKSNCTTLQNKLMNLRGSYDFLESQYMDRVDVTSGKHPALSLAAVKSAIKKKITTPPKEAPRPKQPSLSSFVWMPRKPKGRTHFEQLYYNGSSDEDTKAKTGLVATAKEEESRPKTPVTQHKRRGEEQLESERSAPKQAKGTSATILFPAAPPIPVGPISIGLVVAKSGTKAQQILGENMDKTCLLAARAHYLSLGS